MDPFLGEIRIFGGNFAPQGWAFCDGSLLSIDQNSALYSLIGTTYGGDGITNFALPNLLSRFAMSQGQGPGLSNRALGQALGETQVTLLANQVGGHTHTANCSSQGTANSPQNAFWGTDGSGNIVAYSNAAPNAQMLPLAASAGGNLPHENMQPYQAINFIIALQGIYPSRG
ncbi:MAG TPA: tail fiber protein [Bryobacteraceae bacterium]|nr:tail fiber protein [Bryobacteraceae bacterium]